ncbi:MAG: hypothetical protein ACE5H5_00080 [Nitrospinota bacterium]
MWAPLILGCVLSGALALGWPAPAGAAGEDLARTIGAYQERLGELDRALTETDRGLETLRQQLATLSQAPLTVVIQKRLDASFVVESVSLLIDGRPLLTHIEPIHRAGSLTLPPHPVPSGTHTFTALAGVWCPEGERRRAPDHPPGPSGPHHSPEVTRRVTVRPGQPFHLLIDIFTDAAWIETRPNEPRIAIRD